MSPFPPEPVLKPRDLGQLLDQSFKVFTRSWRSLIPFGLLAAIPTLLQSLLTIAFMPGLETGTLDNPLVRVFMAVEYGDYSGLAALGAGMIVFLIALLLLFPLYHGGLIDVATRAVLHMPPVTMRESFRVGAARYWSMLGALVLVGLIWIGIPLVPLLLAVLISEAGMPGLSVLVILTVPFILLTLATLTVFTGNAVIIEGQGATGALRRSFELAKSRFWALMGIGIVFSLLTMVLSSILVTPVSFATGIAVTAMESPALLALPSLVQGLTTAVVTPFTAVGITLTYFDTRIRREGYDLQVMAQQQSAAPFQPQP